jgi:DNA (cytosine-5)-methyltransferase 1
MTHGSLFSGIGGFDLAAEWMGWENLFHCEWDSFCQKVLKYYWPKSVNYGDITKTDFTIWRGKIDILTGGFPCQPYSQAGKRLGKEDDRHLWPEMLRAIQEIQPRWVVGENVSGLINWNGGLVFHEVQTDLEVAGYEVQPFVLPACGVNAPHRRDRVWFVAHAKHNRHQAGRTKETKENGIPCECGTAVDTGKPDRAGFSPTTPDTDNSGIGIGLRTNRNRQKENEGWEGQPQFEYRQDGTVRTTPDTERSSSEGKCECEPWQGKFRGCDCGIITDTKCIRPPRQEHGQTKPGQHTQKNKGCGWANFPTEPPICDRNDGISDKLVGITFPKWRNESIKAMGNAIVPQVVFEIFKAIQQYENTH